MVFHQYEAGFVEVRGQQWPVFVSDGGTWLAKLDGKDVSADTKEKLRAVLMRKTQRAAVELNIQFLRAVKGQGMSAGKVSWLSGWVRGVHAGNGNLIVEWAGKRGREQWDRSGAYGTVVFPPLSPETRAEYNQLVNAAAEADRALRKFEDHLSIHDLKALAEVKITEETANED